MTQKGKRISSSILEARITSGFTHSPAQPPITNPQSPPLTPPHRIQRRPKIISNPLLFRPEYTHTHNLPHSPPTLRPPELPTMPHKHVRTTRRLLPKLGPFATASALRTLAPIPPHKTQHASNPHTRPRASEKGYNSRRRGAGIGFGCLMMVEEVRFEGFGVEGVGYVLHEHEPLREAHRS